VTISRAPQTTSPGFCYQFRPMAVLCYETNQRMLHVAFSLACRLHFGRVSFSTTRVD
jgi:hypothetical protein